MSNPYGPASPPSLQSFPDELLLPECGCAAASPDSEPCPRCRVAPRWVGSHRMLSSELLEARRQLEEFMKALLARVPRCERCGRAALCRQGWVQGDRFGLSFKCDREECLRVHRCLRCGCEDLSPRTAGEFCPLCGDTGATEERWDRTPPAPLDEAPAIRAARDRFPELDRQRETPE